MNERDVKRQPSPLDGHFNCSVDGCPMTDAWAVDYDNPKGWDGEADCGRHGTPVIRDEVKDGPVTIHPAHFASNNAVKTKLLTIHDLLCDGFTRPAIEQVGYLIDNLEVTDP